MEYYQSLVSHEAHCLNWSCCKAHSGRVCVWGGGEKHVCGGPRVPMIRRSILKVCARCFKLRKYARWRDVLSKVVGERFYFCLFVCRYARWRSGGLWRDILRKYARWRGFLSQLVGERFFFL